MFSPFLADAGHPEGMPGWINTLLTFSGGSLVMGIFNYVTARITQNRKDIADQKLRSSEDRKEGAKADATVEVARVQAKAELESKYFSALENERKQRGDEITALRGEFDRSKITLGHEIRNLRNALNLTQEVYHQLWTACTMLAMQCRIMRSRVKRAEGDRFDESEFPLVEIEVFDPKKLFSQIAPDPAVGSSPDPRKLTGRITLTPDDRP